MKYAAKADDSHQMSKLRVLDLFSGIGGFSLGLERTGGFETVAFCEIEPFPRKVLAKHWPEVPIYEDVRTLTGDTLARDGIAVDVITGGFPCQDLSVAGRLAGLDGERSGLWSEIVRLTGELRPQYVIVENVANLLSGPSEKRGGWFGRVLGDLAECGYDAEWENIPASALGAPHRRERVWLCAYPSEVGPQGGNVTPSCGESSRPRVLPKLAGMGCGNGRGALAAAAEVRQSGSGKFVVTCNRKEAGEGEAVNAFASGIKPVWSVEPAVGRVANGVPNRVDRLAGLGNAVVPQIPELIGRAILEVEGQNEIRRQI